MSVKLVNRILMCEPRYYSVDYVINPWMQPGSVDKQKAMEQWKSLVKAYQSLSVTVEIIQQQPGVPDMVFAADQGIVKGKKVLLSRFRKEERRGETTYYEPWFREHGYEITQLPEDVFFEGNGDTHFWKESIFVGVGVRTDKKVVAFLEQFFKKEVVPMEVIDPLFFHLDVSLFDLDDETVFYYPPALSETSIQALKQRIPNMIEFTKEEVDGFSSNSVVSGKNVLCQAGNPTFEEKLQALGYTPIPIDVSEFMKAGGGINCLTNVLEEHVENSQ